MQRETHRLYLRELGRGAAYSAICFSVISNELSKERLLMPTEMPVIIALRRLEKIGYDDVGGIADLNAGEMPFLLEFVFKSTPLREFVCHFLPGLL
jgi:hypothetical protein